MPGGKSAKLTPESAIEVVKQMSSCELGVKLDLIRHSPRTVPDPVLRDAIMAEAAARLIAS